MPFGPKSPLKALLLSAFLSTTALAASAQTVLRLDEVAVGELDPAKASDYADSILMFNAYDTLVLPAQGEPGHVPHLATEWTADGNVYTFTLRDDVKFHSGNPLTAEDVVFSIDRMKALGQGLSFLFEIVESAEAVDPRTVRVTLTEPYAPFIASLVRLPVVDKATVMANLGEGEGEMGDWGQGYLSANDAGSGAYIVQSHNPQEETVFAKNSDYFLGVPEAAPDEVRLRYGLEAATVRALLAQSEHDITSQWLPPEVLKSMSNDGAHFLQESGTGAFYIKMNTQKPPLDDVNCRLALASAFDYATAIAITQITPEVAGGVPSTGAIPVGMLGSKPRENGALARDMDAAREHLAQCQYNPADYTIELSWVAEVPVEERFALLMQQNFSELGFNTEIVRVPWVLFTEQVVSPETTPHISQIFANAVTGDPDTLLYPMYHSSVAGTWQSPEYLNDPEVDRLLDAGRTAATQEEREAAYLELNDRLMALAPTIYGFDRNSVFGASPRVHVSALEDPSKAFALDTMGFTFRLMEMTE
ncbi:ABC transporter substrate-binding protein [Rubellimicrobium roseum]|uniref:ABC transporter substrate-binding protein n=1 Tax=Rubellimicrobium roseum TaxID=687525 RepID=A0A5C4N6X2_9RHOB|nr:ABC transporter substrate-binding protein [Rubellimicrobium roseum]TNC62887.1 ABC transporter substrate-binding protein [Rubellimicrobium roseum]